MRSMWLTNIEKRLKCSRVTLGSKNNPVKSEAGTAVGSCASCYVKISKRYLSMVQMVLR